MSFVEYKNLNTPNDVLAKIVEFIKFKGYTVIADIQDDSYNYGVTESIVGKKFIFKDITNTYCIHLRSVNGIDVFSSVGSVDSDCYGIAMTISTNAAHTSTWYGGTDYCTLNNKLRCAWMPVNSKYNYNLYCNGGYSSEEDVLLFSLMRVDANRLYPVTHLSVANLSKTTKNIGGYYYINNSGDKIQKDSVIVFSGSATNASNLSDVFNVYDDIDANAILPIYSSSSISNTFMYMRPSLTVGVSRISENTSTLQLNAIMSDFWWYSGSDATSYRKLVLPYRVSNLTAKIPTYREFQAVSSLDWGLNSGTLNGVCVRLPIWFAVCVEPLSLHRYAKIGNINNLYYGSLLNMQTAGVYDVTFPVNDGKKNQVFPFDRRRGRYGFDGILINQ